MHSRSGPSASYSSAGGGRHERELGDAMNPKSFQSHRHVHSADLARLLAATPALLSLLFGLLSIAPPAQAGIPDPSCPKVHPADELNGMLVAPNSPSTLDASILTIELRDVWRCEPVPDAAVVVYLTSLNPACPGAVLTGTTNAQGITTITVAAGGCADGVAGAGVIKANGVTIRSYVNVKSPDWDGARSDGVVNLADLISFAQQFNGIVPAECHDYTNDGVCDLSDLTIFGPAFSRGLRCP